MLMSQSRHPSSAIKVVERSSRQPTGLVDTFHAAGLSAQHVRIESLDAYETLLVNAPHCIVLHDLKAKACEFRADDVLATRQTDLRGRLAYVPAGCRAGGWMFPESGPQSFTALFVDSRLVEGELSNLLARLPQRPELYFYDSLLASTLAKVRACLIQEPLARQLYLETLCTLAAVELCQHQKVHETDSDCLSSSMARRVVDYMDHHLDQDVSLGDLAKVAHLSRFHFLRAFKRATNETPYQLLIRRRLERAQELLRLGQMRISEVAVATGFKTASRLTAAFKRTIRCTPSDFCKQARR